MDKNRRKELEQIQNEYITAYFKKKFVEKEIKELEKIQREEIRLKMFDLYFKKLQPLIDAGINLKYDEKYQGYYFPEYQLYYRLDDKLYDGNMYVSEFDTVENLIENILNPKRCDCE